MLSAEHAEDACDCRICEAMVGWNVSESVKSVSCSPLAERLHFSFLSVREEKRALGEFPWETLENGSAGGEIETRKMGSVGKKKKRCQQSKDRRLLLFPVMDLCGCWAECGVVALNAVPADASQGSW